MSMAILHHAINLIFSLALFINAALFIPQARRIIQKKNAEGVSLVTFGGFLLIQLATVFHGIISHDIILTVGYLLSILTCGSVVVLTILYRKKA